ncbi:small heat shock protein, chloroplastic-like [Amaranthus tricolor]|uniref:small heat shock protein, chloroplastic-like n=1 Tax=Amaranthus tricolor TaxID=29722 RepID=UPI00258A7262|nr:small heat shock protein, chloroplastic-like [Amaranthus tricolor]
MASINVLTSAASTLVSNNRALTSPFTAGSSPISVLTQTPSMKTSSTRPSFVVKAQQAGPNKIDPLTVDRYNKKVAILETNPYVRTPWNTEEDEKEIRMWFDMPGLAADNIEVDIVDDFLVIKGDGGIDAFGNKIHSPYDSRLQLPFNSWKEEVTAVFKNGVLYVTVPKILKNPHKMIHIPVRNVV